MAVEPWVRRTFGANAEPCIILGLVLAGILYLLPDVDRDALLTFDEKYYVGAAREHLLGSHVDPQWVHDEPRSWNFEDPRLVT